MIQNDKDYMLLEWSSYSKRMFISTKEKGEHK